VVVAEAERVVDLVLEGEKLEAHLEEETVLEVAIRNVALMPITFLIPKNLSPVSVHLEDLPTKSQLQMHHHPKNQNKVFLLNSQTVGQMAKLNLQPIAISVLETQASTKKLDCRKKWLAVQNVVDQDIQHACNSRRI